MTPSGLAAVAAVLLAVLIAAGCANTIRGMGEDTASAVQATKRAGSNIASAAY